MHLLCPVTSPLTGKSIASHYARVSPAFCSTRDIDRLDVFEEINFQNLPHTETANWMTEFADESFGLAICFGRSLDAGCREEFLPLAFQVGHMTAFRPTGTLSEFIQIAYLYGFVAVALLSAELKDVARPSLDHRYRDGAALLVIYLSHADFAA